MITPEIIRAMARAEAQKQIDIDRNTNSVSTTDATATVLLSIDTINYERGVITYVINGIKDDGITGISIQKTFSYKNDSSTLTIHTETTDYNQSDFTTASVAANANGFTIEVKVTGDASTNITWMGGFEQTKMNVEVAL